MSFFQRFFAIKASPPPPPPEQTQLLSSSDPSLIPTTTTAKPLISTHLRPLPQQQQQQQQPPPPQPPSPSPAPLPSTSPLQRQLSLLFTGVAFVGLSALVTRRSIVRRRISLIPRFFHPSHDPPTAAAANGAKEALEALSIATVNVFSHAVFWTGGIMWALDFGGVDDMRAKYKRAVGLEGVDLEEAEEEFQEWLAETFAKKKEERKAERDRRRGEGGGGRG